MRSTFKWGNLKRKLARLNTIKWVAWTHSVSAACEDCLSAWRMEHLAFSSFHHCRITHLGVDLEWPPFLTWQGFFCSFFARTWEMPFIFFDHFSLMNLFWLARKSFPVVINQNSLLSNTSIFCWCFVSWVHFEEWVLLCLNNHHFSHFYSMGSHTVC